MKLGSSGKTQNFVVLHEMLLNINSEKAKFKASKAIQITNLSVKGSHVWTEPRCFTV